MTPKRRIAEALSALLDTAARVPGRRFYQLHLDKQTRKHRSFEHLTEIQGPTGLLRFHTPSRLSLWRAETLFTKEPATISWIDGFTTGDVFWDIGANIGVYSLYAALTRGIRTLAFEPSPANFANLCTNVALNRIDHLVEAYPIALSDQTRLDRLVLPDSEVGSAFSSLEGEAVEARDGRTVSQAVTSYSIDHFVEHFDPAFPNHIKIDVDGIEERIVAGAARALADPRLRSIQVEMDLTEPVKTRRIQGLLEETGFALEGQYGSPLFPDSPACNYQFFRSATAPRDGAP